MKNLFTVIVNKWLKLHRAPSNESETPDYDGGDYDAVLDIHGAIGDDYDWVSNSNKGVDLDAFNEQLTPYKGKKVLCSIHSQGGNVWDGFAIHNAILSHGNVDTKIEGIGASAASVVFQAGKNRIMPKLAQQMMHKTSTITYGNAQEHEKVMDRLKAHDETLAKMYASRSGKSVEDCMNMMDKETWMDGDQCKASGMCDTVLDCMPSVSNSLDLSRFRNVPAPVMNQFNKQKTSPIIMDRTKMISLLKGWGVQVPENSTDKWLEDEIAKGKPALVVVPPANQNQDKQPTQAEMLAMYNSMKAEQDKQARIAIERRVENLIVTDRLPANQRVSVIECALVSPKILDSLEAIDPRPPGFAPVSSVAIETASIGDIWKGVVRNRASLDACMTNRREFRGKPGTDGYRVRQDISNGSKENSKMIRGYINKFCSGVTNEDQRMNRVADLCLHIENNQREFNGISNADAQQGPYGSATVASNLQRQVIFSEAMRAFKRKFVGLSSFAHTWNSVPLEGNDTIVVPYYPLFTTGSYRFVSPTGGAGGNATGSGFQFNGTDQAEDKNIIVGGVGGSTKIAGVDRAYQAMTWSSYLLRRQPWVDILKLVVMRVEQLAIDIGNDIISAWILKANFGTAVYSNSAAFFQTNAIAQLAGVASKLFWPDTMRTLVINTDFWVSLLQDPALKSYLNIGTTDVIRETKLGSLYKFGETIENPILPITSDGNLAGWIAYPSAVLCATAPIMPAPGVMRLLLSYDVMTDDQTGLSFSYRYWGELTGDEDREIVECPYGSGFGEGAALRRLVVSGT